MENQINISVRNLVEFVLRSGSIDSGYLSMKRLSDGIKLHQKLQKLRKNELATQGLHYESEVTLKHSFTYNDFKFIVEGRADGIITTLGHELIEEIKSTIKPPSEIKPLELHWAQAKCYACIYCILHELLTISIRLTYCHLETNEAVNFERTFSATELESFVVSILEGYYTFANLEFMLYTQRLETALNLKFPFEVYRKNQRGLAIAVYKTITEGKRLFAQAPTGTGKTVSTIFPAIKALGKEKIFYLTAKTATRTVAEEALLKMKEKGLIMRSITLTAKDKICFMEETLCNPIYCPYANGHFDRINSAIIDIVSSECVITRTTVVKYAKKYSVCPFEYQLDISRLCDFVICDYNHAYDPKAQLKRFFGDEPKLNIILLNDEAHNLVERACEMFSAQLDAKDFVGLEVSSTKLKKILKQIKKWFITASDEIYELIRVSNELPKDLPSLLRAFTTEADTLLSKNSGDKKYDKLLNLYFLVLDFLRISEFFDKRYVIFMEKDSGKPSNMIIKLLCLDPSYLLAQVHKRLKASIFFSATLTPMQYFRDVLGGTSQDYGIKIATPFDLKNLCVLVNSSISTRYKDRQRNLHAVASSIYSMICAKRGNYFVFFSSYEYMQQVLEIFSDYSDVKIKAQSRDMSDNDKTEFINQFGVDNMETLVGFLVLGGVFSEGIDLIGERLIGAAIVGVGLPLITTERNLISDYYKAEKGMGFEYAYMYPGMNKVTQAAGRVIRTESDRGVVLLIDSRFASYEYNRIFPEEWKFCKLVSGIDDIGHHLKKFWDS